MPRPVAARPTRRTDHGDGRRRGIRAGGASAGLPAWVLTLTAFALAVEVGDWQRLTGRTIGAFLGLVPTVYSLGQSRSLGGITKTGNGHARRLLVEAAAP
jgi:hypothetical protein